MAATATVLRRDFKLNLEITKSLAFRVEAPEFVAPDRYELELRRGDEVLAVTDLLKLGIDAGDDVIIPSTPLPLIPEPGDCVRAFIHDKTIPEGEDNVVGTAEVVGTVETDDSGASIQHISLSSPGAAAIDVYLAQEEEEEANVVLKVIPPQRDLDGGGICTIL